MIEFIQANVSWIALGVVFVLMIRMHGGSGAGCCGGQRKEGKEESQAKVPLLEDESVPRGQLDRLEEKDSSTVGSSRPRSGCCH